MAYYAIVGSTRLRKPNDAPCRARELPMRVFLFIVWSDLQIRTKNLHDLSEFVIPSALPPCGFLTPLDSLLSRDGSQQGTARSPLELPFSLPKTN